MEISTILVAIFIGAIIIAAYQLITANKRQKAMKEKIASLPDFKPTQQVMGEKGNSGLAVDEERKKVCLISIHKGEVVQRIVSYRDLISVEIVEDGTTLTKTVRSSQIGGALVGGLVLGGVGAIIGGLSGTTKTTGKAYRVDLRLVIDDTSQPIHDVAFLASEATKGDGTYQMALAVAGRWQRVIEVLIRRADQEVRDAQTVLAQSPSAAPASSIADELKKLAELHQGGVLSQEEFDQQKRRLLAAA